MQQDVASVQDETADYWKQRCPHRAGVEGDQNLAGLEVRNNIADRQHARHARDHAARCRSARDARYAFRDLRLDRRGCRSSVSGLVNGENRLIDILFERIGISEVEIARVACNPSHFSVFVYK